MSKVIMFSRVFPSYHPKAGQLTHFVEKILISLKGREICSNNFGFNADRFDPKHHTIRKGNRFKTGDMFSPRFWEDKPYRSKQIIIAQDIEIKKTWDFEMDLNGVYSINGKYCTNDRILAANDGLNIEDMFHWFMKDYNNPKEFKGQIICWNENINY